VDQSQTTRNVSRFEPLLYVPAFTQKDFYYTSTHDLSYRPTVIFLTVEPPAKPVGRPPGGRLHPRLRCFQSVDRPVNRRSRLACAHLSCTSVDRSGRPPPGPVDRPSTASWIWLIIIGLKTWLI